LIVFLHILPPGGDTIDVTDYTTEPDTGIIQNFVKSILLSRAHRIHLLTVPANQSQLTKVSGWDKAWAQQSKAGK